MKFQLTFKTPDVTDQLDDDEQVEFAEKYLTWGEYITVEFDTEKQTAVAVPN